MLCFFAAHQRIQQVKSKPREIQLKMRAVHLTRRPHAGHQGMKRIMFVRNEENHVCKEVVIVYKEV